MWLESTPDEGPFDVLNRLLRSPDLASCPGVCQVFADYAHDSFFLLDDETDPLSSDLLCRYGGRALAESVVLASPAEFRTQCSLDHLACRYYRIVTASEYNELLVRIQLKRANSGIRCFLSPQDAQGHRLSVKELSRGARSSMPTSKECEAALSATLRADAIPSGGSVVLTVANCGLRKRQSSSGNLRHDDDVPITIELSAAR
jgi:hypothetical protein